MRQSLTLSALRKKFLSINQAHLLTDNVSSQLCEDLLALDLHLLQKQCASLEFSEPKDFFGSMPPFSNSGCHTYHELGEKIVKKGKCACVVLAGGVGSRLRFSGPKGCFPISLVKHKSLYQLIAEKVHAASKQMKLPLEVAFMFSPINASESIQFFERNAYFGLAKEQISFCIQEMWPYLDFEKKLFLENPDRVARGPSGNGSLWRCLDKAHILPKWERKGIECLRVVPIDNPLADPFDCELVGFHAMQGNEVSIQAAKKTSLDEKVGTVVQFKNRVHIVEYTESRMEEGIANLGLYCFSLPFVQRIKNLPLPIHPVKKSVLQWHNGMQLQPEGPNAWKFEEFIFDSFPTSERVGVLNYPKEACFAPLKNFQGADSIEAVQGALLRADKQAFFRVSGTMPLVDFFELEQTFHYPTPNLLRVWKGKELSSQTYIEGRA